MTVVQPLLVGVDVGGTKIAVLITTPDGVILGRATRASSVGDQDGAAEAIATTVETALLDAGASVDAVAVIGVGVPGRVDPLTGRVTIAVNLGWTDLALRDALEARLGRPCVIENDARAAAVGSWAPPTTSPTSRWGPGSRPGSSSMAGSTVALAGWPARSVMPSPTRPARSVPAASAAAWRPSSPARRSRGVPPRRWRPTPRGPVTVAGPRSPVHARHDPGRAADRRRRLPGRDRRRPARHRPRRGRRAPS